MTQLGRIIGIFLCFCSLSKANTSIQYDLRYQALSSQINQLTPQAIYSTPVIGRVQAELGSNLSLSSRNIQQFSYKGELSFSPLDWFALKTRLSHAVFFPEHTSMGSFLATAKLDVPIFSFFGFFGSFGWYERLSYISELTAFPLLQSSDFTDHDFAFTFGIRISPARRWSGDLFIGTYDEMEVFRLNNPYFQATVNYQYSSLISLQTHFRYRILLGFGRLDEFMFGVGLRMSLSPKPTQGFSQRS